MGIDLWIFENQVTHKGFTKIAGIDEAGRGPLAGPVVSASVILPSSFLVPGVNDSKKITPKKRSFLYKEIYKHSVSIGVGIVDVQEIDRINILQATLLSMAKSVHTLDIKPDYLLIDGIFNVTVDLPQKTIPKGDALSISIAAASIIAKVTRDKIMSNYHKIYPEYGFLKHKGYPTKAHREAVKRFGPCPIHRRSFKGVKEYCAE